MEFTDELRDKIYPLLKEKQPGFIIHGPAHISRCLIFGNTLCHFEAIEFVPHVFYAICFHDSGRVADNGVDHNDAASQAQLKAYLEAENKTTFFEVAANFILKNPKGSYHLYNDIVYDTDVLEIMRESCGVGVYRFNRDYLRMVTKKPYADALITECIKLIRMTDNNPMYNGVDSMDKISDLLRSQHFNLLLW